MPNLEFYTDAKQIGLDLITEFGDECEIIAYSIITGANGKIIKQTVFTKTVLYLAKVIKNTLIQDRFYETAELSIILPSNSFEFVDRYKYRVEFDGQSYEVIRHRSYRPGPVEVVIELALRKSGTGENK